MVICIGIDAAKVVHWAVGIDDGGVVVLGRAVENTPSATDACISELRVLKGDGMIGIDMVGSFARFIESSLLAEGFALLHIPGIVVNRAVQGFSGGERKSDSRDAGTIAELVCTRVALRLKVGRRRVLMQDQVCRIARIRWLLCGIHPGLEQAFDLCTKVPLALLTRYVSLTEIRPEGQAGIVANLKKTRHLRCNDALALRA